MAHVRAVLGGLFLAIGISDIAFLNIGLAPRLMNEIGAEPVVAESGIANAHGTAHASSPLPKAVEEPPPEHSKDVAPAAHATMDQRESMPEAPPFLSFNRDSTQLSKESTLALAGAIAVLKARPDLRVLVRGHTCTLGSKDYNLELSRRRAQAVEKFLVDHGVLSTRIGVEALGGSEPLDPTERAAALAKNRRVELVWQ